MYRALEVRNFRGLRDLTIGHFGPVNLITGLNDAGKSSLLEALFLHASGPLAGQSAMGAIRTARGQEFLVGPNADLSGFWDSLFYRLDTSSAVTLRAKTDDGDYSVMLAVAEGAEGSLTEGRQTGETPPNGAPTLQVTAQHVNQAARVHRLKLSLDNKQAGPDVQAVRLQWRLDPPADGPYMRGQIIKGEVGPNLVDGYSQLRRRGSDDILVEALKAVDDRIGSLEVLIADGRPQLHVSIDGFLLPIELLGDGPVSLAKYLIAIDNARGGMLVVDDIGSDLHHSVLTQMWRTLHRFAERQKVQIFATSHSDECVSAAYEALSKRPDQLVVHRLRRGRDGAAIDVATYSGQKLGAALEMNAELR